ncbi:family 2 encapsulin nanocompartment cargo protein polyprenyl transferase [Nocardia sp. XZ_19_231]|uniref:family 2 encapsulin nanocompartment cargo protein polyprenyl transferase n=1 Tax=Nocardia sp. XZ_19_231 TaxID=2769252 RepID=UPI00188E8082|nr:family 2 encapsulin nanocompartment cargo protein polyprenyl transferase [Nocardia sp. XZ_19_231]
MSTPQAATTPILAQAPVPAPAVSPSPRTAADILDQCREACSATLHATVQMMPATVRTIVGYHFGWWDPTGRPEKHDGGKAIRPALVLSAARLTGGDVAAAVRAAVAVELVHNFSLLHDDVMDRDTTRRHRPTAWTAFGIGPAILAGDALVAQAYSLLAAEPHSPIVEATNLMSRSVLHLVEGQCADLGFERRTDVEVDECLTMVDQKTGALFGCSAALGGLFGNADSGELLHLQEFGRRLGRAFQHTDDLLGIWGDPHVTGKSVFSDLRSRKKSLPVVFALRSNTPEAGALADLYLREKPLDDSELVRAAELIEAAGGREWSRLQARQLYEEAMSTISQVGSDAGALADLDLLAALAADRDC